MERNLLTMLVLLLMQAVHIHAAVVEPADGGVLIRPDSGQARVITLQAVADGIVRVRATCNNALPQKAGSLMVVHQTLRPAYTVDDKADCVLLKTAKVRAMVNKRTGEVTFLNNDGTTLLKEARGGKMFRAYRVPDREIGVGPVTEELRCGLSWQLLFDSPDDEAFYGLGQHQSEELDMKGCNEDLFQYNTKVSVPFIVSSRHTDSGSPASVVNYGLLWDSYSYCRFGQPDDYRQLNGVFRLYDREGRVGGLTATYTDRHGHRLVRQEDSLYYEYDLPAVQQKNDAGGIKNLPAGFQLDGAKVVYEGFLEPQGSLLSETMDYQFILYYAGYVKVYVGDSLVVPERWRTAWNPNSYKFTARVSQGRRTPLRIEWKPDGGTSYIGLRVAAPRPEEERGKLSIWSEMAQDMDYYFIAGESMDEVIAGYRTLTGKAPVYPRWVMGYWQSRERYKTAKEVMETFAEFRRRHLPIDNIVQDWNYWPEDQWGSHRFETTRFPSPQALLDSVHQQHGRLMISVWPKFYCNTDHYKELDRQGWMYRQAVQDSIRDWVGRGYVGSFYDAYSEGARRMFWRQMDENLYTGLAGKTSYKLSAEGEYMDAWWMDASEPNVRDCTPMWYRKALCGPTALGTSTEYFNAYALVNAMAIYEGQRSVRPGQRVFLLTRSGFAGLQRYSTATWSGDIGTRWEDMRAQMTAGMNYSLSGLPFWGMDMGGFCVENRYVKAQQLYDRTGQENEDLKEWRELQTRWCQFGTFVPLFRAHGQWPLREPWNIAPEGHPAYASFVYYDQLRYRLMPYLYSMAGWVHLKDYTMMRALIMDFGHDSQVRNIKDQWMFGPSLMACPVSQYGARSRMVYFPQGRGWYDLYSGRYVQGGQSQEVRAPYDRIPVFVPEGSIIPFGPAMEWSDEKPADPITLYVYSGRDARFTLYEDEGTNYRYEQGCYSTIDIRYDDVRGTVTFGQRQGQFSGMLRDRRFRVVCVTPDAPRPLDPEAGDAVEVKYTGEEVSVACR